MIQSSHGVDFNVGRELGGINAKLDSLLRETQEYQKLASAYQKLFYAFLGNIAATIGAKFVGSPANLILFTYTALFCAVFMSGFTLARWKYICKSRRFLRLAFCGLIIFSTIVRSFIYEAGIEIAPSWFTPTIDVFYIIVCILAIISIWRHPDDRE